MNGPINISANTKEDNYFVYYYSKGSYIYERTCGTEQSAKDRVAYLSTIYPSAVYLINHTINKSFY